MLPHIVHFHTSTVWLYGEVVISLKSIASKKFNNFGSSIVKRLSGREHVASTPWWDLNSVACPRK